MNEQFLNIIRMKVNRTKNWKSIAMNHNESAQVLPST